MGPVVSPQFKKIGTEPTHVTDQLSSSRKKKGKKEKRKRLGEDS
jgi:hypothetical protein